MAAMGRPIRVSLRRIVSLGCCLSTGTMGFEDGTDAFSADFFNETQVLRDRDRGTKQNNPTVTVLGCPVVGS